jgi:diaminopimelate decarboxylase/aspartate kinase
LRALSQTELPCFVYDAATIRQRSRLASSLLDRCFFPVKACPEPAVLRAVLEVGFGLDLCSEGDLEIAAAVGCAPEHWKFTSACASGALLRRLHGAGAWLDADSLEQALSWMAGGGKACGLRVRARNPKGLYGAKFGVPVDTVGAVAGRLGAGGGRLEGVHLHDQHANLTPMEFAARLAETFAEVGREILRDCSFVNIGGSWPMRHGTPAPVDELRLALNRLREHLGALGFKGGLYGEPGRWVVGPCGYWAARVAAVKLPLTHAAHGVVVLDTNTPVPCRPSLAPFVVLREGQPLPEPRAFLYDIYGSANTALDLLGAGVRLPAIVPGDVVVAGGHGAYTRSLIPPFNERDRPEAVVLGA